jgi:Co/Zn/Cd efflux system component
MDRRVRTPQPIHLPPAELDEGPQHDWSRDPQEPPITRNGILRWALLGAGLTLLVMVDITFAVSMFVVLIDPSARASVLTALISAVFGLPATLLAAWLLWEKNQSRNRSARSGSPRRKR